MGGPKKLIFPYFMQWKNQKQDEVFFQIFVAFSEHLTFIPKRLGKQRLKITEETAIISSLSYDSPSKNALFVSLGLF